MQNVEPVEVRIASVSKDKNNVICITMKDCGMVDEYDVMDLNLVIRHQANGSPCLKLLVATGDWEMSKKAREMAEKEDNISKTAGRAIVVSNTIKASLFNFLKKFSKKAYPQQFFDSREEAYAWLLSLNQPIP